MTPNMADKTISEINLDDNFDNKKIKGAEHSPVYNL